MQIKYLSIPIIFILLLSSFYQIERNHLEIWNNQKEMEQYEKETKTSSLFGILEIPTISLKQPIYPKESKENNVEKNIMLLEETILKKEPNHVIVLAAHSGSGIHSYFKNLSLLKGKEEVYFYYQQEKYKYRLFKKEEVPKTGTIFLDNYDFSHIILITCSKTNSKIQEVYYAKFLSKE